MASNEEAEVQEEEGEREDAAMTKLGSYGGEVRLLLPGDESAAEEIMLLWGIQQPTLSKPNAVVSQSSLQLCIDSCGHSLSILQSPSSLVLSLSLSLSLSLALSVFFLSLGGTALKGLFSEIFDYDVDVGTSLMTLLFF